MKGFSRGSLQSHPKMITDRAPLAMRTNGFPFFGFEGRKRDIMRLKFRL